MTDPLERRIIETIQDALRTNGERLQVPIKADDSMDTVATWDSMSFMSIFLAINEEFGVNPDFDDAIHYTSVQALYAFLKENIA